MRCGLFKRRHFPLMTLVLAAPAILWGCQRAASPLELASCTVSRVTTGVELKCGNQSAVINDGATGATGATGLDGVNGCQATANAGGTSLSMACPNGSTYVVPIVPQPVSTPDGTVNGVRYKILTSPTLTSVYAAASACLAQGYDLCTDTQLEKIKTQIPDKGYDDDYWIAPQLCRDVGITTVLSYVFRAAITTVSGTKYVNQYCFLADTANEDPALTTLPEALCCSQSP